MKDIEFSATLGKNRHSVYHGSGKNQINDIGAWQDRNIHTLAGAIALRLRGLGFIVLYEDGYPDPREPEPPKMIISW